MKTPYQIKIEKMQDSFVMDTDELEAIIKGKAGIYGDNPLNKRLNRTGQRYGNASSGTEPTKSKGKKTDPKSQSQGKVTPQEYAQGLGAEKWNPKKLGREMDHHKNMATLTGDTGHMQVYEHLSKLHKDHPDHLDEDKVYGKEKATQKMQATKKAVKAHGDRLAKGAKDWHQAIAGLGKEGAMKSGSKERKALAEKMKGLGKKVLAEFKNEAKEWKEAGGAIAKVFSGKASEVTPQEKKAIKTVVTHMAVVAAVVAFGHKGGGEAGEAATTLASAGVIGAKVAGFLKAMAVHYVEHAGLMNVGKAVLKKADDDGNEPDNSERGGYLAEEALTKLFDDFTEFIASGEIDEKKMMKMIPKMEGEEEVEKDNPKAKVKKEDMKKNEKIPKKPEKKPVEKKPIKKGHTIEELLHELGVDESKIEKAKSKYGQGKKTIGVQVKGKKGYHIRQQEVGEKYFSPQKKTVNKNAKLGGGTPMGATINNLATTYVADMKAAGHNIGKGIVLTELAHKSGYGVTHAGVPTSDAKDAMYKVIKGKMAIPDDRLQLIAEYFGLTLKQIKTKAAQQGGAMVAEGKQKVTTESLKEADKKLSGPNYAMIREAMNDDSIKPMDKVDIFLKLGVTNGGVIQLLANIESPYPVMERMKELGYDHNPNDGFKMSRVREGYSPGLKLRDPRGRFVAYASGVLSLVDSDALLCLAFGAGGVGKSYWAKKALDSRKQRPFVFNSGMIPNSDDYDYVRIAGRGGMGEMIKTLFSHSNKLIIFDDYDSVLKPPGGGLDMVNIMKAAFDSGETKRVISHGMGALKTDEDVEVPKTFTFKGKGVIISNLPEKKVPQPIIDRTLGNYYDLSMTLAERLTLIGRIHEYEKISIDDKILDIPTSIRKDAYDYMRTHAYDEGISESNQGLRITPRTWKGLAVKMQQDSMMSETQLKEKWGNDWAEEIQDVYFRAIGAPILEQ